MRGGREERVGRLRHGPRRIVVLEDGGSVVRKTYTEGDLDFARAMVEREFRLMTTFRQALSDCPGATCPAPLAASSGPHPHVRMTRATGLAVEDHLYREDWPPQEFAQVADVLRRALCVYVGTFREPYWDFLLRNMLYDRDAGVVTFLDFEIPPALLRDFGEAHEFAALEFSLGSLVGVTAFEARRPKRMHRRHEHRQAATLVRAVLHAFADAPGGLQIDRHQVRAVARRRYLLAATAGGMLLRAWY